MCVVCGVCVNRACMYACVRMRAYGVCACARAYVHACVRASVCVCGGGGGGCLYACDHVNVSVRMY